MSLSSKTKALKNKVTGKVSDVLSAGPRAKAARSKRQADRDVGIIKDRRAMKRSGTLGTPQGRRVSSAYQDVRDKYKK